MTIVQAADLTTEEAAAYTLTNAYLIRVSTDDDAAENIREHTFSLTTTFADYPVADDAEHPTITQSLSVTLEAAACDCALITWDEPYEKEMGILVMGEPQTIDLIEAGPNPAAMTATAGARACGEGASLCDGSYAYTVAPFLGPLPAQDPLPDWIVYVRPDLTVTPTLAEHIGTWVVLIEQVRLSNGLTRLFEAATVTVGCVIEHFEPLPVPPLLADATYAVFGDPLRLTLPNFEQYPPCAYALDETFTWTKPEAAGIYADADPYTLVVDTANPADAARHTVFVTYDVGHEDATWEYTLSYDIIIEDPCRGTELVIPDDFVGNATYSLTASPEVMSFSPATDTVTQGIVADGREGSCGDIVYTWTTNSTDVGTGYLSLTSLIDSAYGFRIYSEDEGEVGDYLITLTVTMADFAD